MANPTPDRPARRRRRFALTLRGVMLLVLVLGGLMGWKARRASLQRRAVAAIERAYGHIIYDYQSPSGAFGASSPSSYGPRAPQWLRDALGDEYFREITGVYRDGATGDDGEGTMPPAFPGTEPGPEERARVEGLMAALATLDHLRTLQLGYTRLSPAAVADLGRLTGLTTLTLDDVIDADAQLASLRGLTRLEHLIIHLEAGIGPGAPPLDQGLENLAPLTRLRELHLTGDSVRPRSLDFVAGMADLEILGVEHSPWREAVLDHLAGKPRLRALSLDDTNVTDAGMARIAGLAAGLNLLSVNGAMLTDAGLARLAKLKDLEHLQLGMHSPGITDAGLAHLAGLTRFRSLQIRGGRITDAGLAHLAGMVAMEDLRLARMPISDAGLAHLAKMAALVNLDLAETRVTGLGLAHLPSPSKLGYLMLAGSPVTDDGLAGLSGMTGLTVLYLSRTKITDAGLARLTALKSLQVFDLDQTAVTQAGLAALRPGWNPPAQASQWARSRE